jgi:hypothetical protein
MEQARAPVYASETVYLIQLLFAISAFIGTSLTFQPYPVNIADIFAPK